MYIHNNFRSNLSVSAEEFVPRTMARNTSQWAYQQQQQQQPQQQQRQVPDYSANSYGYQPHMDYPGSNYGSTNDNNQQFDASVSTSIATICSMYSCLFTIHKELYLIKAAADPLFFL